MLSNKQKISVLKLKNDNWIRIEIRWCISVTCGGRLVVDVCQWLAVAGHWFSPVSLTISTDSHDITDIYWYRWCMSWFQSHLTLTCYKTLVFRQKWTGFLKSTRAFVTDQVGPIFINMLLILATHRASPKCPYGQSAYVFT